MEGPQGLLSCLASVTARGLPHRPRFPPERNPVHRRRSDPSLQRGLSAPVCQAFHTGPGGRQRPPDSTPQPLAFPETPYVSRASRQTMCGRRGPQSPRGCLRPGARPPGFLGLFQVGDVLWVRTTKFMLLRKHIHAQVICVPTVITRPHNRAPRPHWLPPGRGYSYSLGVQRGLPGVSPTCRQARLPLVMSPDPALVPRLPSKGWNGSWPAPAWPGGGGSMQVRRNADQPLGRRARQDRNLRRREPQWSQEGGEEAAV